MGLRSAALREKPVRWPSKSAELESIYNEILLCGVLGFWGKLFELIFGEVRCFLLDNHRPFRFWRMCIRDIMLLFLMMGA